MSNKIGVAITDAGGTFQLGTCHPDDFYLTPAADVRINWGGSPRSDYGAFYDTTDQPLANIALAQVITINSTSFSQNVFLNAGSQVKFSNAGTFNLQFSLQFTNDATQPKEATIWFRKNGTDISNSASTITIDGKHGGIKGHYIISLNLIEQFNANDYVELWWSGNDVLLSIETLPAGVAPVHPVVPSVIFTATKVL